MPDANTFSGQPVAGKAPVTLPFKPFQLDAVEDDYDLIILGGGLAGMGLALQVKRSRPETTILVVEKQNFPRPEAAFKVGESTQEMAAHYLSNVLGLKEHLNECQLLKFGVRFFLSQGDNSDITHRIEAGRTYFSPFKSYQLDRGRLENIMALECRKLGIKLLENTKARRVELSQAGHQVELEGPDGTSSATARWIVDASGRSSVLKRQLGLQQESGHNVNATWFRIKKDIDINTWSDALQWRSRQGSQNRRFSTNHIMGKGYWVWFIPLASGSTSIGIVSDARLHPFSELNRFDRALNWLKEHEPQVARVVEECQEDLQDFRVLKNFSYGATKVFSVDRWCLTGEAGVFLDPLYSPGSDYIAVSNTLIADLVQRDLAGEPINGRVNWYDQMFLSLFESSLLGYKDQYELFGNAQVMMAKLIWDGAIYWGFPALLYCQNRWTDLNFMRSVMSDIRRCSNLQTLMQQFFHDWHEYGGDERDWGDLFVKYQDIDFLKNMIHDLARDFSDPAQLKSHFHQNVDLLEDLADAIITRAVELHPELASRVKLTRTASGEKLDSPAFQPEKNDLREALDEIWFDKRVEPAGIL
ncbi:MAG TPA: tryptophan 7-halogenase [Chloroflexia bacterium]|nr:tryptophan 7-halogenase [Chloroflexia bacterium]